MRMRFPAVVFNAFRVVIVGSSDYESRLYSYQTRFLKKILPVAL